MISQKLISSEILFTLTRKQLRILQKLKELWYATWYIRQDKSLLWSIFEIETAYHALYMIIIFHPLPRLHVKFSLHMLYLIQITAGSTIVSFNIIVI